MPKDLLDMSGLDSPDQLGITDVEDAPPAQTSAMRTPQSRPHSPAPLSVAELADLRQQWKTLSGSTEAKGPETALALTYITEQLSRRGISVAALGDKGQTEAEVTAAMKATRQAAYARSLQETFSAYARSNPTPSIERADLLAKSLFYAESAKASPPQNGEQLLREEVSKHFQPGWPPLKEKCPLCI